MTMATVSMPMVAAIPVGLLLAVTASGAAIGSKVKPALRPVTMAISMAVTVAPQRARSSPAATPSSIPARPAMTVIRTRLMLASTHALLPAVVIPTGGWTGSRTKRAMRPAMTVIR